MNYDFSEINKSVQLWLRRNVFYFITIIIAVFMIYLIYYYWIFFPKNIVSIYVLLIMIGFGSYRLEHWVSYPLYALHVFLLPILIVIIRTSDIQNNMGVILNLFIIIFIIFVIIVYFKNVKSNIFKMTTDQLLPEFFIVLFLLLSIFLPKPNNLTQRICDIIIIIFIPIFVIVSLSYLNRKYRRLILQKKLMTNNLDRLFADYVMSFERYFPSTQKDSEFILYYFERALNSFILGDFEDSYMNSFKIVFDPEFKGIYKINDYDKRRPKYRDIRAAIAHPKKDELFETVDELKKFRKTLFENALDIISIVKNEFLDHLFTLAQEK